MKNWGLFFSFSSQFSLVQFSRSVMSDSLRPHELQHARPPCPSPPTPRVHSNSCPSSWWCHPTSSSSVFPFSSCPQSLPASESFPVSQLFAWGGQTIGVSALASVLPMNTQDWYPLEWTGWISLQSKGFSRVFSNTTVSQEEKGTTEDEMAGWHHRLDGREFEWTPGDGDGQGGLVCCDSWGRKELDMTERLNWTESFKNQSPNK